jgi:hypothetical protein
MLYDFLVKNPVKILYLEKHQYNNAVGQSFFVNAIEKIYLTDNGKIARIKLEGIFDLIFHLIEAGKPDFLSGSKVKIEDRENFSSLDLVEIMDRYREDNYKGTYSSSIFKSDNFYREYKKNFFPDLKNAKQWKLIELGYALKDKIPQAPQFYFAAPNRVEL